MSIRIPPDREKEEKEREEYKKKKILTRDICLDSARQKQRYPSEGCLLRHNAQINKDFELKIHLVQAGDAGSCYKVATIRAGSHKT